MTTADERVTKVVSSNCFFVWQVVLAGEGASEESECEARNRVMSMPSKHRANAGVPLPCGFLGASACAWLSLPHTNVKVADSYKTIANSKRNRPRDLEEPNVDTAPAGGGGVPRDTG